MEVSRLETNKEIGALHKMGEAPQPCKRCSPRIESIHSFVASSLVHVFSIDHECLKKYGEEHGKFCLASLLEKREDEDHERFIGYNGLYRYGSHRIQFQFDASTGFWRRIPGESHRAYGNDADEEEDPLNVLFEDLNQSQCLLPSLTLDQQIQLIIKRLDQHFSRSYFIPDRSTSSLSHYSSRNSCAILLALLSIVLPRRELHCSDKYQSFRHVRRCRRNAMLFWRECR